HSPGARIYVVDIRGQAPIRVEHHALLPGPERSRGNLRPHRAVLVYHSVHKLKGSDRPGAVDEYLRSVGRQHPSTEGGEDGKGIAVDRTAEPVNIGHAVTVDVAGQPARRVRDSV